METKLTRKRRHLIKAARLRRDFMRSEGGASGIEYVMIAGLIGLGIVVGLQAIATETSGTFTGVANELDANNP